MKRTIFLATLAILFAANSSDAFAITPAADSTDASMTWVLESKTIKLKGEKRRYTDVKTIQVPGSAGTLSKESLALGEYYGRMMRDSLQLGKHGFHELQTYYAMQLADHRKRIQEGTDSYPVVGADSFDPAALKWKKALFGLEVGLHETNHMPLGFISDYTQMVMGATLDMSFIFGKFIVRPSLIFGSGKIKEGSPYIGGGPEGFESVISSMLWFVSPEKYSMTGTNSRVPFHSAMLDLGYVAFERNGFSIYPYVGFGTECWNFCKTVVVQPADDFFPETIAYEPAPIRAYVVSEGIGFSYEAHKTTYMGKGKPHYLSCPIHARIYTDQIFNQATGGFSPSVSFSLGIALHYHQIKGKH
ncbi:MAG: hypothetical protein MJY72_05675 [Bacteroidales bacterium]|nr:hypothetical protein [Bacteroidales bacterium]